MTIKDYHDDEKSSFENKQHEDTESKTGKEELFFDGENYYTKEEFFNPEESEEPEPRKKNRKGLKIALATLVTVALLSNVFAIWPRLFNIPAIEFISVSQDLSSNEDVQLYKESVVVVRAGNSKGTGFYISEEGYIMTNEHVVGNDPYPVISFENGETYTAEVIETYEEIDIAILSIEPENIYPSLDFSLEWEEQMPVYVIGNPLFFNYIANEGSLIGTTHVASKNDQVLMLDAPIYQGSSGSPVITEDGDVIGVVYATTRVNHEGSRKKVGLAIPAEKFTDYIPD